MSLSQSVVSCSRFFLTSAKCRQIYGSDETKKTELAEEVIEYDC